MRVLVTGATGYIGGRLVPRLLSAGHEVRVLVRAFDPVKGRPWEHDVEVVQGDLLRPETLPAAVTADLDAAYYLVHSMYGGEDFAARDRAAANHFVSACAAAVAERAEALRRVVYLGGLMPKGEASRSGHLRSRAEVGRLLAEGLAAIDGRPRLTEFRAGPIIGSGSASFEMVRYLTERLPVMVTPKWVKTMVTPVAVRDVLAYLESALGVEPAGVVEIGSEPLSYRAMMQGVAAERGLRRLIIPLPVLAPKLAARWVGLVTPIPNALAVPLVEGVTQDLIADTTEAARHFPGVEPIGFREAVRFALTKIERGEVETRWSSAVVAATPRAGGGEAAGPGEIDTVIEDREGLARDQRTLGTDVPAEFVFRAVCSIGGGNGWYVYRWAWWLRGVMDALVGGPGLRRGRRHPTELLEGEALDWWRVDAIEQPPPADDESGKGCGLLRLRAEMRVPGRAWLQWETERRSGRTILRQTALFEPRGLPGTLYWYSLLPAHGLIFPALLRRLEREARKLWYASLRVDTPPEVPPEAAEAVELEVATG
ncbi:MAG: SDR family oxidoreductase [Planctomycetota bacterium]